MSVFEPSPYPLRELIHAGAVFFCSHSGGKDSQAMYAHLLAAGIPDSQIVVVHADLGEVEWNGVQDHIRNTIDHDLHVVRANKTLLEMVQRRFESRPEVPSWPSSATRQCTSDLKRGPIYKFIRRWMKENRQTLGVNCMGIRAEESSTRAKKEPFKLNTALSKAGREVYEWMPIFDWSTDQVFRKIKDSNQQPFWAYEQNERLSCVFCIMGSRNDLMHGLLQRPELFRKYTELEQATGWTMFQKQSLSERIGLIPAVQI
ncbi:MAG: phosphoadenosine phosphosulfate reductase family protein [Pseudomonadota bacterium]